MASAPVDPDTRIPREVWVLIAAAFVIALGFGLIAPVLPQFAQSFNVGITAASIVVSAFSFSRLVFAPASGRLVTSLGERRVYLIGLLIVAASTAACALAQSYGQLLVFRGLGGFGSTMFTVSALALIVRITPPGIRGKVSSAYATAFLVGNIGGPILGGALGGVGYRVPFLVYAVALVIAAAVVAVALPTQTVDSRTTGGGEVMSLGQAWGDSAYRAALATAFANGWANFGVRVALVPLYAASVLRGGPWVAGASLAVFAIGNGAVLQVAGRYADARGRRPPVLAGLIISGLATAVLGVSPNIAIFFIASLIAGAGAGLTGPAVQSVVADVVGNGRSGGKVLAAFQMVQDLGTISGPVLAAVLADRLGYGTAFAVTGLIALAAAATWLPARETLPATALPAAVTGTGERRPGRPVDSSDSGRPTE